MITILHGDNIEASRTALVQYKHNAKDKELRVITGSTVDTTDITQAVQSSSLFGGSLCVVFENVFSKLGKKPKKIEEIATVIQEAGKTEDIVIWEDKELGKTVMGQFPGAKTTIFKTPVLIFQFLDALRPNNASQLLKLYQSLTQTEAPELVSVLIGKRLRTLIMIADHVTPVGMQSWQIGRLTTQAKLFTMKQLVDLYKKLISIELSIKSGTSPFTMKESLELWLATI